MASRADLDLARRLLTAGVLPQEKLKEALALQGRWLEAGRDARLPEALYALKLLPAGCLDPLLARAPTETQPFPNYRLDTILGEGGGSIVYGGVYVPNGTPVAVKVLDPVHRLRAVFRERFRREARLHVELEHENIVAGYEHGSVAGYEFYSMDLVDGATVLDVIERRGRLSNEEALSITLQAARALGYLHEKKLLHRDIKPGNVMVEASGRVRLIDLGLVGQLSAAEAEGGDTTVTVGTVEYLSPEQARGRTDLDARADVYSLGMTLYHMVVGEVAFQGATDYEVMAKQVLSSMDAQKIKTRHVRPEITFLIAKMSAKERADRCGSMAEVCRVIEGYLPQGLVPVDLGSPPVVQPVQPPPAAKPVRPTPRRDARPSPRGRRRPRR